MHQRNRGISAVGVIVILVVIAAIVGGAAYFLSDPFRTKVDTAYNQFAQWTPENIAANPSGYLDFCETQAKKAQQDLKAAEVRIAQKTGELENMKTESLAKIETGDPILVEFKQLYKDTAANNAWPVTARDKEFDEAALKRQIISLHKELEGQREIVDAAEKGLKALSNQKTKVEEQKNACAEQLRLITINRSKLEIQEITDELKDQLVNMKGVIQSAVAIGNFDESTYSLDELTDQETSSVDDEQFQAILNQ